jgi:hypothetical protein
MTQTHVQTLQQQGIGLIEELEELEDILRLPGHRQTAMVTEIRRAILSLEMLQIGYKRGLPSQVKGDEYARALISTIRMTRIAGWRAAAAYIAKEQGL